MIGLTIEPISFGLGALVATIAIFFLWMLVDPGPDEERKTR